MKRLIFTLLILMAPSWAWGATYNCVSTGSGSKNFSDPTAWTSCNGTYPHNNGADLYTALISTAGMTYTVDVPVELGISGASGTNALRITGSGSTLYDAAGLTLKGGLFVGRGAVFYGVVGGGIAFTPPAGSTYTINTSATGTDVAAYFYTIGESVSNPYIITTTQGGGGNAYLDVSLYSIVFDFTNTKLQYLGDSSTHMITAVSAPIRMLIDNVHIDNCGEISSYITTSYPRVDWNKLTITNSLAPTYIIELRGNVATNDPVINPRIIKDLAIYSATKKSVSFTLQGLTVDGFYAYNITNGNISNLVDNDWSGLFFINDDASTGNVLNSVVRQNFKLHHSIFLNRYPNPHVIVEPSGSGGTTDNQYTYNIFDGDGYYSSDAGDLLIVGGNSAVFNHNININRAGTLASLIYSGGKITAENNTSYDSYGISIGETAGASTQVTSFKNNLIVSQPDGFHDGGTITPLVTPGIDYNAYYDITKSYGNQSSTYTTAYLNVPKRAKISSVTCTTGTTTGSVVASGATFISSGVTAGDWWYNASRAPYGVARIISVDSETQLTLATPVPGGSLLTQQSGDTGQVRYSYFDTDGLKYGDDENSGLHDINTDPQFYGSIGGRSLADYTVRGYGGWLSLQEAGREMVTVNGIDYTGSVTTPTTKTVQGAWDYITLGFTPTNAALDGTGYGGIDVGAVDVSLPASSESSIFDIIGTNVPINFVMDCIISNSRVSCNSK